MFEAIHVQLLGIRPFHWVQQPWPSGTKALATPAPPNWRKQEAASSREERKPRQNGETLREKSPIKPRETGFNIVLPKKTIKTTMFVFCHPGPSNEHYFLVDLVVDPVFLKMTFL